MRAAPRRIGRYQLEAAIQSAHVEGARTGSVSWAAIVSLYDALVQLTSSPVAFINRALAVAELEGPASWIGGIGGCRRGPAGGIVSALLGRARKPAGPDRIVGRCATRISTGDWPGKATPPSENTSDGAAMIFRSRVDGNMPIRRSGPRSMPVARNDEVAGDP